MSSCAKRSALTAVLALAACSGGVGESPSTPVGDALTPKYPEMIEAFTGMDLQRPAPERPADLVVQELAAGSGDVIHYGMIGRFHYIGSLANGKVFQSTYKGDAAEPVVLRLLPPAVPEGLALGLEGCKKGERRLIRVPSQLGYGERADYSYDIMIPPNSTLIYEIELVEVVRDLAVKILVEGSGDELVHGKQGRFNYTGVLAEDGRMFDASQPGQPSVFTVSSEVIPGWALALPGMKTGEKRRLRIPSELAYGETGAGPQSIIGANADLVFDVELVEIMP